MSVLILFLAKSLAAVNPAGPPPITITSESVYSSIVSWNIVAIALVISFSLTSAKIFSMQKYTFHSINTYILTYSLHHYQLFTIFHNEKIYYERQTTTNQLKSSQKLDRIIRDRPL